MTAQSGSKQLLPAPHGNTYCSSTACLKVITLIIMLWLREEMPCITTTHARHGCTRSWEHLYTTTWEEQQNETGYN